MIADATRLSRAARSTGGPPGKPRPNRPGDLVEGFPRGVVDGRAERFPHRRARSSTRSSDEWPPETSSAIAGLRQWPVFERVDRDVRGQVIHAVNRLLDAASAKPLAAATPTSSAPASPGPGGNRDRVDVGERDAGRWRAPGGMVGIIRFQVRAAGYFGHDAAEPGVQLDAGRHRVGEQRMPAD